MSDAGPFRHQSDLAEMVEMLLDKGLVINADIAVTVGETELLGVHVRAALASFETAAQYGLEFPAGTDMNKVEDAVSGAPGPAPRIGDDDGERRRPGLGSPPTPVAATPDGPDEEGATPVEESDADGNGGAGTDEADANGDTPPRDPETGEFLSTDEADDATGEGSDDDD